MPVIIPIFIVNEGCPHRCLYCCEETAAGPAPPAITEAYLRETILSTLKKNRREPVQIAFYGGNFTGLGRERQQELLEMAGIFIREGLAESIRISTRPDYIFSEDLDFLEKFHVRTVEIGAQSLVDEVLGLSRRGHTAAQVRQAVYLLKKQGFETGIHLMAGLPGDSPEGFAYSVEETIALRPHLARVHPTLVFAGTELASLWAQGNYRPLSMVEAIAAGKLALAKFAAAGIPVIRLGLQTTAEMEKPGRIAAGPYHPSFRSLVEEALFFDRAAALLSGGEVRGKEIVFSLSPRDISSFRGQNNSNIRSIKQRFGLKELTLAVDPRQSRGSLILI